MPYRFKLTLTSLFKIQSFKFHTQVKTTIHGIIHAVQQILIEIYSESVMAPVCELFFA